MRFIFQYRTSDNASHEGVIDAASRDAAFAMLKERGIRPSRVVEAPGLFNKLLGKGKRWIAIVLLAILSSVAIIIAGRLGRVVSEAELANTSALTRRQIYGDPALMERLAAEDYRSVFETEADRYLAHFAQPAADIRFEGRFAYSLKWKRKAAEAIANLVEARYQPEIVLKEEDGRETRELKRIVMWMREELAAYLGSGSGTVESYVNRLEERQLREMRIYNLAKIELQKERDPQVWEKRNAELRAIGAPTIPIPADLNSDSE